MNKITAANLNLDLIYSDCAGASSNDENNRYLLSLKPLVLAQEVRYKNLAQSSQLYSIPENEAHGITDIELVEKLYDSYFAKKETVGRQYYDVIMLSAPHGVCPNCNQRIVSTLDHYLPKTKFSIFSLTPHNLIPCCGECNKEKLSKSPRNVDKQSIHPYFDDVTTIQWLYCDIITVPTVGFKFYVRSPQVWSSNLHRRIEYHFNLFKLKNLFSSHAGSEFANIKHQLKDILNSSGQAGVITHINRQITSRQQVSLNSWQVAMYQALATVNNFSLIV